MRKILLILCTYLFCLSAAQAQNRVTGVVTSAKDGTNVVASVFIKGTNLGVSTDNNGKYILENVPANATLVYSSVGFQDREIPVNGRSVVNATLEFSEETLDDVIVVAYGTAKKSTFTGSAAVVKKEAIEDAPNTSFQKALAGRVSGLQVTTTSGQAGASSSIRIRGIGSMNASNDPLYVIDGVPVISGGVGQLSDYLANSNNVMSTLNPSDIESITVLKDAAASSLYGSRAANGIIVITTKKGRLGVPKITVKSSVGFTPSWATDNWEAATPQDQINTLYKVLHDARTSVNKETDEQANTWVLNRFASRFGIHGYDFSTEGTGWYENVNMTGKTDGVENRDGKFYNWEDALFRTGVYQTNDIAVSGGTDQTTYYSSLAYTSDKSRMIENDFSRINGRVNLNQKIGKYFEFGSNISIAKNKLIGMNDTRNLGTNYLFQTRNLLWPLYWPTNYKTGDEYTARYGSLAYNPLYYNKEWENSSNVTRLSAVESLTFNILPELNIKTIFSYDNTETKDHIYYSAKHYAGSTDNGNVSEISTNYTRLVSSTTANYLKQFGLHSLGVLVGFEAEKNNTEYIRASGKDLPSSALHTVATAGQLDASAYSWGNNMLSGLSRLEYNFDERYYGSASFRRDGSSKLGLINRGGNFWSLAGSWRIKAESFMQDVESVNDLRIRASYGGNGTLPGGNYGWRSLTSYGNKYMEQPGGGLANAADKNLTWETNYSTNLALEFGLFQNKLFGTVEYFNRDSESLLLDVPTSTITGFSSTLKNVGEINNRGIEFELGSDIIKKGDWRWSASVNGSFIKSKVTKLYKNEGEEKGQDIIWNDPSGGDARTRFIYREGESTLSFFGLEWAGVDKTNGRNVWYTNNSDNDEFEFNGRGATYTYTKATRVIIGDAHPDFYGGFNTDVEYKGLSLGLNFIYKVGGNLYDGASKDVADDGYYWERTHSQYFVDETWSDQNPNGSLPRISGRDLEDVNQVSSRHLYDASFLRLKNVLLSYKVPAHFIQKAGINNARVYFNGSNLMTFSKFKNADPEVNQYGTRGWETPIGKTYTFGIEFSF